jgi:RimJ/RimL family protein N-acetyltransferase
MSMIRLVMIGLGGKPEEKLAEADLPRLREVLDNTKAHYERHGFHPPWCGYLALRDEVVMGVCGFRGPPDDHERVEIAYRIFSGYERQGLGSAMVEALVGIARDHNPQMTVLTTTELEDEASSHLLTRMGFVSAGECEDPWLGRAWSWWLEPGREPYEV